MRKGDTVVVIAGKERGKRGKVLHVYPAEGRVIVERLNMMKKHQKPTPKLRQGGIIEREAPLHRSNVMLLDPRNDKPTRIGVRLMADGTKTRIARKSGETIDKV